MPSEIEHKYLVLKEAWTPQASGVLYRQGYLSSTKERVVRVRIAGDRAYLTVKGPTTGVTRLEFEYPIPINDAATMLEHLCERPLIEKTRYREEFEGHRWEIDVFYGDNCGLVIADISLPMIPSNLLCRPGRSGSLGRLALFQLQSCAQSIQKLEDINAQRWHVRRVVASPAPVTRWR